MDINEAIKDSPAVQKAKAFREAQLATDPSKEQLRKAGIDDSVERAKDPEAPASEIVFTDDVATLPKDASGRVVTEGIVEVFRTADTQKPLPNSVVITERPTEPEPRSVSSPNAVPDNPNERKSVFEEFTK